jgi:hypothetical protein
METFTSAMTSFSFVRFMRVMIALCMFILNAPPVASADVSEDESLKGIAGVMVIVERLHADAATFGLERETLDAVVRGGLQKAGIKILSADERMADERRPYLYVNCNVMDVKNPALVTFSIDIEVHQRVTLASGEKAQGLTWAKSYLGIQSADRASEQIRHVLAGYVEQFIAAYKKANTALPAAAPGD